MCHYTQLMNFCWGRPQTAILQISASRIAKIIGMSHCTLLILFYSVVKFTTEGLGNKGMRIE
jgi:hypothetical protein